MPSKTARHASRRKYVRRGARIGLAALTTAGLLAVPVAASADTPMLTSLLQQGSVGPNVARVQHALHINDSGHFTRATKRAVIAYQRRDGLLVDGIVGPQTWGVTVPPPGVNDHEQHEHLEHVLDGQRDGVVERIVERRLLDPVLDRAVRIRRQLLGREFAERCGRRVPDHALDLA